MKIWLLFIIAFGYALLDAQTVVKGATEGLQLAMSVIIPSLLPFIFLSLLSSQGISGRSLSLVKPIERLCGMPAGSGSLLLLGVCGGYPVGGQCVANAYEQGFLSKQDAERLLGFCNNAGPSFIFGMVGGILKDMKLCWFLWLAQILSAVIVGAILPGKSRSSCRLDNGKAVSISEGLEKSLVICGKICGWVILFRSLISVLEARIFMFLPPIWKSAIAGILELSNGCIRIGTIDSPFLAFLLSGAMLTFGGICVLLQTKSVIKELSVKQYFVGKLLQTMIVIPILWLLWKITVAF